MGIIIHEQADISDLGVSGIFKKPEYRPYGNKTSCAARWPPQYTPAPADRRPISGKFEVRWQELPTAYVRAKFEDRSFFRLRNI